MLARLVRFAGVGAVGTSVHYGILVALVELFSLHPTIGTACGALGGAITNYLLNHRWTFASRERHLVTGPKFLVVAGLSFTLNPLLLWTILELVPGVPYLAAQVVVTGCLFLVNFALNSLWTFRRSYQ